MKKTFKKNEIQDIAKEIAQTLVQENHATIVALHGDLGAGKTTLSQSLAKELGVQENVISPTFIIMKNYETKKGNHKRLVHIDAYRLNSESELQKLGWEEIVADKNNLVLIEWPERVPNLIPKHAKKISLSHKSDEERSIEF